MKKFQHLWTSGYDAHLSFMLKYMLDKHGFTYKFVLAKLKVLILINLVKTFLQIKETVHLDKDAMPSVKLKDNPDSPEKRLMKHL